MKTKGLILALAAAVAIAAAPSAPSRLTVVEASIPDLQHALQQRRVTSHDLVQQYLTRIALYEDRLNAIIYVNPRALEEADARDKERASGRARGPLHGIPIAITDNIQTRDMPTTGGAPAFAGLMPPYGATVSKNPYDPRRDPRAGLADGRPVLTTGGSSSGVGTSVSFWAANVGTETSGSILSPANQNMLAGIKPTVGRVSRYGIIPITADQDTAGPMARSVTDAAIMLGAIEGVSPGASAKGDARPDPNDAATSACMPPPRRDYTRFLDRNALKGARIGIPRAFFYDAVISGSSTTPRGGLTPEQMSVMQSAIDML